MSEVSHENTHANNYGSGGNEGAEHERVQKRPYQTDLTWRTLHHSWYFWIAMALVTVAIVIYVMSDNLAFLPHAHPGTPLPGQMGQ